MDSTVAARILDLTSLPWTPLLIGLLAACAAPAPALRCISTLFWHRLARASNWSRIDALGGHRPDLPAIVGLIERPLIMTSLLLGYPEFIGLWLGAKVAGSWAGWSQGYEAPKGPGFDGKEPQKINGRHLFNVFLIATAISLVWGIAGAAFVALAPAHPASAWGLLCFLAILTNGFALLLWHYRARPVTKVNSRTDR